MKKESCKECEEIFTVSDGILTVHKDGSLHIVISDNNYEAYVDRTSMAFLRIT